MKIKLLTSTAKAPTRGTPGSAGYDIYADDDMCECVEPGHITVVSTGIAVQIPKGFVGLIQPRSGLAFNYGIDTLAGVIDSDYTGEIKVMLTTYDDTSSLYIYKGDRIAQLVIVPCYTYPLEVVDQFESTERGDNGFGHTGKC
jgi:deoxyuridine 5'-triphosphate nucleotidohydrolase